MSGGGRLCALLLMVLAGCSTVPRPQTSETVANTNQTVAVVAPPAPKVPPPPVPAPPPPAAATNHFNLNETWIPLERWSMACGYGSPRRIATETALVYAFAPTNGGMAIKIGSQSAWWGGIEFRLGFAPQLIDGHPFVHSLDVRKNFMPLLDKPLPFQTNRILVIDPGHGGTDVGTRSIADGHYEKEFTLEWARRLQTLLATNGWTVWLTRTNDANVSLPGRVAFADVHKAALFLSLHFNSMGGDQDESGLETYCLTPAGMPSSLTRGFKDDPALTFTNNNYDVENLQIAIRVHAALLQVNGHLDRGVRRARFLGVLQNQNRPAILVEGGYLSNPGEAREIANPAYREKLAEAVARALIKDFGGPVNLASRTPATTAIHTAAPGATNVDVKTN